MTGTYCPVGLPVSISGTWYRPTRALSFTEPPYTTSPTSAAALPAWAPADVLPVTLPTPALTAMLADGAATMCG